VLVLDLQHFRSINQTYGEHWGDVVLRQVGERLQRRLRGADTVARLGDDEFAGILVGNSEEEAIKSAARLMQALRKPCIAEDGKRISLAGSLGLAIFPDHGEDPDTLVRAAHRAMRMARSAGLDYAVFRSTDSE
jgi:diguanylate cyclase (GGDEF)-like protein